MSYYNLLIVFTIITVALSVPLTKSSPNEPERCCAPKQHNSKTSISTGMVLPDGKTYTSYAYYNFSYDESRGLIGMRGVATNIPGEEQTKLWVIENITDGQMYVINLDTKECEKSINPIRPVNCIPATASYVDSSMYGYGDKQIIGDTWLIKLNGTVSYSTVSRGDCVPLTANIFVNEPHMVVAMTVTDFVGHINDPSVFDIPAECKQFL